MDRLPLLGEGVKVPWGLDSVPGEVIDLLPPNHALVSVPVEGAGHDAPATSIRIGIDVLEELRPWHVVHTERGAPSPGSDAERAWWIDAARENEDDRARVEVRLSGTAASMPEALLPDETRRGIRTEGQSAVEKFAWRFRLPRIIVLGSSGAFENPE